VNAGLLAAVSGLLVNAAQAAPADADRGEQLYARCSACHALAYDRVGPRHCGLIGRRAGSIAGFDYSPAMKQSGIVWTSQALDRFLAAPMKRVPETTMTYAGVEDGKDRADLIAYLERADRSPSCARK